MVPHSHIPRLVGASQSPSWNSDLPLSSSICHLVIIGDPGIPRSRCALLSLTLTASLRSFALGDSSALDLSLVLFYFSIFPLSMRRRILISTNQWDIELTFSIQLLPLYCGPPILLHLFHRLSRSRCPTASRRSRNHRIERWIRRQQTAPVRPGRQLFPDSRFSRWRLPQS